MDDNKVETYQVWVGLLVWVAEGQHLNTEVVPYFLLNSSTF